MLTSRRFSGNKAKRVAEDSKPGEIKFIERERVEEGQRKFSEENIGHT